LVVSQSSTGIISNYFHLIKIFRAKRDDDAVFMLQDGDLSSQESKFVNCYCGLKITVVNLVAVLSFYLIINGSIAVSVQKVKQAFDTYHINIYIYREKCISARGLRVLSQPAVTWLNLSPH